MGKVKDQQIRRNTNCVYVIRPLGLFARVCSGASELRQRTQNRSGSFYNITNCYDHFGCFLFWMFQSSVGLCRQRKLTIDCFFIHILLSRFRDEVRSVDIGSYSLEWYGILFNMNLHIFQIKSIRELITHVCFSLPSVASMASIVSIRECTAREKRKSKLFFLIIFPVIWSSFHFPI